MHQQGDRGETLPGVREPGGDQPDPLHLLPPGLPHDLHPASPHQGKQRLTYPGSVLIVSVLKTLMPNGILKKVCLLMISFCFNGFVIKIKT